ncbi:MAG: AF1514 family protein [Acidiferrobacterales bacterium]
MDLLSTVDLLKKAGADIEQLKVLHVAEAEPFANYHAAMKVAHRRAQKTIGDSMLVSWYDRDRDIESPKKSGEPPPDSVIPGYINYGLSHEASLVVDVENGRFVFIYMEVR